MGDPQARRVRMRFFPEDEHALEQSLKLTTLTSQSNVLRAALMLFEEIWTHECAGTPVYFMRAHDPFGRVLEVLTDPVPQEGRKKTSTSLEIRVTPNDADRIQRLLEAEAADTVSSIVRHAIRIYAVAVSRSKKGETLCARAQDSAETPLQVLGIGTPIKRDKNSEISNERLPFGRGGYQTRVKTLWDLLPNSLAGDIKKLAEKEGCDAESLMVDLVRSEALARLHGFNLHPDITPVSDTLATEPAVSNTVPQSNPEQEEEHLLVASLFGTLEHMTEEVDKLLQRMDPSANTKGQQATFSDLLFGAEEGIAASPDLASPQTDHPLSVLQQITVRVEDLNGRIANLLTLSQHERERKPRKGSRTENKNSVESIPPGQALMPLGEANGEWALVLSTDENGAPQQQVVGSQTIIPLSEEDLSGMNH